MIGVEGLPPGVPASAAPRPRAVPDPRRKAQLSPTLDARSCRARSHGGPAAAAYVLGTDNDDRYDCPGLAALDRHISSLRRRITDLGGRVPAERYRADVDRLLDRRCWLTLPVADRHAAEARSVLTHP